MSECKRLEKRGKRSIKKLQKKVKKDVDRR